jgi:hypothetical protein
MEFSSLVAEFFHEGVQTDRHTDRRDKANLRLICHEREICDFGNYEILFCIDVEILT